jgi:hypothetical protein
MLASFSAVVWNNERSQAMVRWAAWWGALMRHRRLVRDYEAQPDNSASMITIAMIDNLAKRLTAKTTPTWRYSLTPQHAKYVNQTSSRTTPRIHTAQPGSATSRPVRVANDPRRSQCSIFDHQERRKAAASYFRLATHRPPEIIEENLRLDAVSGPIFVIETDPSAQWSTVYGCGLCAILILSRSSPICPVSWCWRWWWYRRAAWG